MIHKEYSYPSNPDLKLRVVSYIVLDSAIVQIALGTAEGFNYDELAKIVADKKPVSASRKKMIENSGKDPSDFAEIGTFSFSGGVVKWLSDCLPTLKDEYDNVTSECKKRQQARIDKIASENKPYLDQMDKQVQKMRLEIPSDHIEVTATKTGSLDGDPIMEYEAESVKLNWNEITTYGWASAIRDGALGAFAEALICSISKSDFAKAKKDRAGASVKAAKQKEEHQKALEQAVPDSAISAYKRCNGNPETLYDDIDHPDYWMVRRWSEAIEYQGLAHKTTLNKFANNLNKQDALDVR